VADGRTLRRGGHYNRLADPVWTNPLDTGYSRSRGGRWNPPGAFGALYLNRGIRVARLQVEHRLAGQPYNVEDLDESEQHDLVEMDVAELRWLDCVTGEGLRAVGLPASYPRHADGTTVERADCQPVGEAAYDDDLPGIACRSAAGGATVDDEELAVFDRVADSEVTMTGRLPFRDWFWP
jgi:RES domain-containing protein